MLAVAGKSIRSPVTMADSFSLFRSIIFKFSDIFHTSTVYNSKAFYVDFSSLTCLSGRSETKPNVSVDIHVGAALSFHKICFKSNT